jgi:hypothetical protein
MLALLAQLSASPGAVVYGSNPFAALTMVAAPAILTNACSVLAMSTSNRFLRASERMRILHAELETLDPGSRRARLLVVQVPRIERQGVLLLSGLAAAYVGLGSFAAAALISLVGAAFGSLPHLHLFAEATIILALLCGLTGVCAIIFACVRLFAATRLSMQNVLDEAACIRDEHAARNAPLQLPRP